MHDDACVTEPFPPDPHGDLGVSPGDRLVVSFAACCNCSAAASVFTAGRTQ